jgi:hypothetical protein
LIVDVRQFGKFYAQANATWLCRAAGRPEEAARPPRETKLRAPEVRVLGDDAERWH